MHSGGGVKLHEPGTGPRPAGGPFMELELVGERHHERDSEATRAVQLINVDPPPEEPFVVDFDLHPVMEDEPSDVESLRAAMKDRVRRGLVRGEHDIVGCLLGEPGPFSSPEQEAANLLELGRIRGEGSRDLRPEHQMPYAEASSRTSRFSKRWSPITLTIRTTMRRG